jgi:hypothetical protein
VKNHPVASLFSPTTPRTVDKNDEKNFSRKKKRFSDFSFFSGGFFSSWGEQ